MALKINRRVQRIIKIIGWVLVIAVAICMVKILAWERNYYNTKSAETRSKSDVVITQLAEAVSPSEEQPNLDEYQVEASKPRYLTIERLGIKARIKESTVNSETLAVPQNIYDAMWSAGSGKPGQGGAILMSGLECGETKKGAFANLDSLEKKDSIEVELGNGTKYTYKVAEIRIIDAYNAENELPSIQRRIDDKETLTLITAKQMSDDESDYTSIVIIRAILN